MAAVRYLGIVALSCRTTHEVFTLGHISLSNLMLIRCIILKIWGFEFFADLAWNAYIRVPKISVFGKFGPQNVIGHHLDPKRHICAWNHVLQALNRSIQCLSICLSVCRLPRHNSTTERPRKPKIGTMEVHHTNNSWTYLEVKRSTIKVTRSINADTDNATYRVRWEFLWLKGEIESVFHYISSTRT